MLTQVALREDALTATPSGFELRVGLPWIRSLPLSGVTGMRVELDRRPLDAADLTAVVGPRRVALDHLVDEVGVWWYLQDRVVLAGAIPLAPGIHHVCVDLSLFVPYLKSVPNSALVVPFHLEADLEADRRVAPSVARDVA